MRFFYENFEKSWIEGNKNGCYRHYDKNKSLEREKSKIPESASSMIVERESKEYKKHLNNYLIRLREYRSLNYSIISMMDRIRYLENEDENINSFLQKNHNKFINLVNNPDECNLISSLNHVILCFNNIEQSVQKEVQNINCVYDFLSSVTNVKKRNIVFLCPCPNEKCQSGLISSETLTCASCNTKICKRCREIENDDETHVCNEDTVANIASLKHNTRPCPKCATSIYKIDGCDQMWCTQCKTAFSWNTGELETGALHNPHAIRWRRENGHVKRDINDIPCGGLIDVSDILIVKQNEDVETVINIHRSIAHVNYLINSKVDNNDKYEILRQSFIKNNINLDQWKQSIFVLDRENYRRQECRQILQTYRDICVEQLRNFAITTHEIFNKPENIRMVVQTKLFNDFINKYEELRLFINDTMRKELKCLGSNVYDIISSKDNKYIWLKTK